MWQAIQYLAEEEKKAKSNKLQIYNIFQDINKKKISRLTPV